MGELNYIEYLDQLENEIKAAAVSEGQYEQFKNNTITEMHDLLSSVQNSALRADIKRNVLKHINLLNALFTKIFLVIDDARDHEQDFDYELVKAKVKFYLEKSVFVYQKIDQLRKKFA